jgi:hypothetical protein
MGALLEVCQMLESENLRHELLHDGYKGIGASGEGPNRKRKTGNNAHPFVCTILEVEGAQGYDLTAVELLTDVVYSIAPT